MKRAAWIPLALWAAACSLSPERMAEVDTLVESQRGSVEIVPATEPLVAESALNDIVLNAQQHHLVMIEQGSDALAMRIHLIRSATEQIELMNYIFHEDESGHLLLGELIDAARRGVTVRILVDSLFSLDNPELLAGLELLDAAIDIRLYNPLFARARLGDVAFSAAVFCCFQTLNHRLHHKLLSVDRRHGLIGGRNTADRYFDLDTRMNFLDMEVLVTGPVVTGMVDDFDHYWLHSRSRPARHTREVAGLIEQRRVQRLFLDRNNRAAYSLAMVEDPHWLNTLLTDRGFRVGPVSYFSDPPDKAWGTNSEVSTRVLHELIAGARHRILIQTPYFILSKAFERVLSGLDDSVEVVVSTNSLAATDAWPVYALSRRQHYRMVNELGIRLYEAKPYPVDIADFNRRYEQLVIDRALGIESPMRIDPPSATHDMPGPRISVHAKILVIDDEIAVVTSHNFDPRSERFNTENGIVVHDREFARAMTRYIETIAAPGNSWVVKPRPDGPPVIGSINRTMARISRSLPTLDLWPWYLTENYRIDERDESCTRDVSDLLVGCEPVGLMPEVVSRRRMFSTGLVSRMLGFLRPIM